MRPKIRLRRFWLALGLAATLRSPSPIQADDDFVILLDQSASMLEQVPGNPAAGYQSDILEARKSRDSIEAIEHVVDHIIRTGDYFALVRFGDEAKVIIGQRIYHDHERELIKENLQTLTFRDRKTDIVAGVVRAGELLQVLGDPQRRKILIVITDGKNDPPADSPYLTDEARETAFKDLQDKIRFNKWNVKLVGLGEHTDISEIANRLGLPANRTLILDDQTPGTIASNIQDLVRGERDAVIEMAKEDEAIQLRLEPRLFGGFDTASHSVTLASSFPEPVEVILNTTMPVALSEASPLTVRVAPGQLVVDPSQQATIQLTVGFEGPRPEIGQVESSFIFQFAEGSTRFYPSKGRIQVILPSWWEVYGTLAIATMGLGLLALLVFWRLWRRAQIPELRVTVSSEERPLGEPFIIKSKETFLIANNQFSGRVVSARGLDCQTAATVRYLGRRRFEVTGNEASLLQAGKPVRHLGVGLEEPFDIKDETGKLLRSVTISEGTSDVFGGSHGSDPF